MKSRGLPGSCGPYDEDHAVRFGKDFQHLLVVSRGHAHGFERHGFPFGQDSHHHVLHVSLGRDRGHAEFDFFAFRPSELDLAVLRNSPHGDVEV